MPIAQEPQNLNIMFIEDKHKSYLSWEHFENKLQTQNNVENLVWASTFLNHFIKIGYRNNLHIALGSQMPNDERNLNLNGPQSISASESGVN